MKPIEGEVLRKGKYDPSMCKTIIEIAESGGHVPAMMKAIGILSKDTFYRWLREYPEFNEAYESSKVASQAFYEEVLLAGALGKIKNFNFNALAMTLNNKFGEEYKRTATGSSTEVNIGTINNLKTLDVEKLMAKAAVLQKEYLGLEEQGTDSDGTSGSSTGTGAEEAIL